MSPPVPADVLRKALEEGPVKDVLDDLPEVDDASRGLCVDASDAEAIQIEGKTRLSLLRIFSKGHGKKLLVGQIQVLATSRDRDGWDLEFYAHDVKHPSTREFEDRQAWRREIKRLHEKLTGFRA